MLNQSTDLYVIPNRKVEKDKTLYQSLFTAGSESLQWIVALIIISMIQVIIFVKFWNSREGERDLIAKAEILKDNQYIKMMKMIKGASLHP